MTDKKFIKWEPWIDPLAIDETDDFEPNDDNDSNDDEPKKYKDSYQKVEDMLKMSLKKKISSNTNTGPILVGPMGVVPLNEHNIPSKVYCFWMGHANFDITRDVLQKIENTPGVEALDVFTRYRFRVAIGKAFLTDDDPQGVIILKAINNNVCPNSKNIKIKQQGVELLKKKLVSKYPFWVIFTLPDGSLDPQGRNTKEELEEEVKRRNGNIIATSWE
jgi:hypothetical protein